ncbi:substrate-binding domain-containing protein, partial [Escherichia coli]|uniref:substrate-binding domain-containing protein n=1 Tax=Escherichia coli TaxID=562 RepID=UPI0012BE2ABA
MNSIVRVENLELTINGREILKDVSFEENIERIKNILGRGYKVISLFSWEEGIVLREGSKRLKDLKNSLWLVREEGSGARKIFEDIKQEMEIENLKVIGGGHREVAFNIKEGLGDA